jgi:hypothetical protein
VLTTEVERKRVEGEQKKKDKQIIRSTKNKSCQISISLHQYSLENVRNGTTHDLDLL